MKSGGQVDRSASRFSRPSGGFARLIVGAAAAPAFLRRGDLSREIERAVRRRGLDRLEIAPVAAPGGGSESARQALADGAALVIAAGGDGTVREVAGRLAGTRVPLGIVPLGTGNLFASAIGIGRRNAAIEALASGESRSVDIGWLTLDSSSEPQPLLVAAGSGLDARVIGGTPRDAKRRWGIVAYFAAAARAVIHLEPRPTWITVDGRRLRIDSTAVLVVNAGDLVPGLVRPHVPIRPDDGLLDVFVVRRRGLTGTLGGAVDLLTMAAEPPAGGGRATARGARFRGREVRVEIEPPDQVEVDGDIVGSGNFVARVDPLALNVLAVH